VKSLVFLSNVTNGLLCSASKIVQRNV